jgi:hypothetical protein
MYQSYSIKQQLYETPSNFDRMLHKATNTWKAVQIAKES